MGLSVSIGLKRLYAWDDNDKGWLAGLRAIVESGAVDCIRDIVPTAEQSQRIIEAIRTPDGVALRELTHEETSDLLQDLDTLSTKFDNNSASFSWDEAESFGMDIQDLTAPFNPATNSMEVLVVELDRPTRLVSIDRSLKFNWITNESRCNHVRAMHELARKHALVIHSA